MAHQVEQDRYNYSLRTNLVKDVLPQYFTTDYPNLVAFLDSYYEYMDSDETISVLDDLFGIRDIERATLQQLDQVFEEIAKGASRDYFQDSREVLRNFAKFYRVKGTRYSAEGFFRAFFSEDVEIVFPKESIFTLGTDSDGIARSTIGSEDLKVLQDGALYQIFSVLLKSAIPLVTWQNLYKRFVHPAGFYLGAEVTITGSFGPIFDNGQMPPVIPDSAGFVTAVSQVAHMNMGGFANHLGILPDTEDPGVGAEFISLDRRVRDYQNFTVTSWDRHYTNVKDVIKANSPTFDDDSSASGFFAVRMDNTAEKLDRNLYLKDSAFFGYTDEGYVASGYYTPE